ncbi:MAG TPA: hypothetical protein VIM56_03130 [Rhizomicrobium sp.]
MKKTILAALAFSCVVLPAWAADDPLVTRMLLCQESWLDWQKSAPTKLAAFGNRFRTEFAHKDSDAFMTPKTPISFLGLRTAQVFPDSVGMGVGFSATIDAPFDPVRKAVEKALGKKLVHCEKSDGMNACELPIAEKRTVTLMAEDSPKATQTLVGCYYYYEK